MRCAGNPSNQHCTGSVPTSSIGLRAVLTCGVQATRPASTVWVVCPCLILLGQRCVSSCWTVKTCHHPTCMCMFVIQGTVNVRGILPHVTARNLLDLLTISINNARSEPAAVDLVTALLDHDRDQLHVLHAGPAADNAPAGTPEQPMKELVSTLVQLIRGCIPDQFGVCARLASLPAAQYIGKSGVLRFASVHSCQQRGLACRSCQ